MNRLTKVIKSKCGHEQIYYVPKYGNPITPINMTDWHDSTLANHLYDILNRLKKYEDTGLEPEEIKGLGKWIDELRGEIKKCKNLEEQGLLIKLPCKVKDTVYVSAKTIATFDKIDYAEAEVISIRITKKQIFVKLRIFCMDFEQNPYGCSNYPLTSFGKTVFLTEKEFKKALEASNGE